MIYAELTDEANEARAKRLRNWKRMVYDRGSRKMQMAPRGFGAVSPFALNGGAGDSERAAS